MCLCVYAHVWLWGNVRVLVSTYVDIYVYGGILCGHDNFDVERFVLTHFTSGQNFSMSLKSRGFVSYAEKIVAIVFHRGCW